MAGDPPVIRLVVEHNGHVQHLIGPPSAIRPLVHDRIDHLLPGEYITVERAE